MRLLRFSWVPLVAVVVSASSCGQDDTPPPSAGARGGAAGHSHGGSAGASEGGASGAAEAGAGGQSGSSGSGGAHAAGRGGGAGKSSGDNGGAAEFGCTSIACTEATLTGTCPAEPPSYGDPCAELGSTCIYCIDSQDCAGEKTGRIAQCCPSGWASNCYNQCEHPGPSSSTGGQGGQAGASGQSGAELAGAGNDAGSCADLLTICCNANADCPSGFECANQPNGLEVSFGYAGTCRARLPDTSRCWVDADCPAHYRCSGALYCGCGYQCNDEAPGTCAPM